MNSVFPGCVFSRRLRYGKYGFYLAFLGLGDRASQLWSRTNTRGATMGQKLTTLPIITTEHASHTTAAWNSLPSTQDTSYESSRLSSQILYSASPSPC